jgi:SulP family sulfate permease
MAPHFPDRSTTNLLLGNLSFVPYYLLRPIRVVKEWRPDDLMPDLVAGLTVGLIALPQAIAFALIANLPPEMGLYATVFAGIVGAFWGSTHQLQTGPANAISILVFSALTQVAEPDTAAYVIAAGLIAVMAGVFQLVIGLARLGILVNFVSNSVIVGFASGAAVLIGVGQLKHLLGLSFASSGLFETVSNILVYFPEAHWPTVMIGVGTIALLVLLRRFNRKLPGPLIVMILASVLVFALNLADSGVVVIGQLPRSLPPLAKLPLFDLKLIAQMSSGALAVAAIGLIQTTAIARSIANETGQRIDNNQEFVGQGMANIVSGFFSGYPGSASFSRSAVSLKAGARTAISAVLAGVLVLLAMLIFAPATAFLPRASLAGVLTVIAYGLIDHRQIARILRGTVDDAVIMVVTFFGTLFLSIEFAVLTGILLSFAFYLLRTSLPRIFPVIPDKEFKHYIEQLPGNPACPQLGIIKISGDLYFGAVNHIEETLLNYLADNPRQRFLLLRMHGVNNCDMNGILMLETLRVALLERGGDLYFMKVHGSALSIMQSTGFYDKLGANHFLQDEEAIDYLFYHVLDPAICIYECEFRVFLECQNLPKNLHPKIAEPASDTVHRIIPEISARELWHSLGKNGDGPITIIDVREPQEFKRGHIPQAKLEPLKTVLSSPETLPINGKVVFVCRGGQRSQQAALALQNLGHNDVETLEGGMLAWESAQLPKAVGVEQNDH